MRVEPLTSVLMPAFGSEATIRASAESVLAQTEGRLELIVVDDASPIPVSEVLADIRDPRLRVLRHSRNRNTAAARNTGLAAARAPFVSQLDADDLWEPDYLEAVIPRFEDSAVGLAYSNTHIIGHPEGLDDYIGDSSVHPLDRFPKFAEACPVPAPTATMRTAAVRAVGGYSRWLWTATDYHLYAKLVASGWRFAYVDRQLAHYRWPAAASKSSARRKVELAELQLWAGFALRHPRIPGPKRQVRVRLRRELERLVGRR
jgi:glycosyltransferase involved in cell wall biosynthesis